MSTKSWSKLTTILQDVASKSVSEKDRAAFMSSLESSKSQLTKLLAVQESSRRKKDPAAPKKPMTNYLFFCQDKRKDILKKNPDMKTNEVTRQLGELWRGLSDKDKKKYNTQAEKDKERYDTEMSSYVPPEPSSEEVPKKASRKRDPNAPKRPLSDYLHFCQSRREELKAQGFKGKDITAELGRIWREEMSDEDKEPYRKMARDQKESLSSAPSAPSEPVADTSSTRSRGKAAAKPAASTSSSTSGGRVVKTEKKTRKVEPQPETKAVSENTPGFQLFSEETLQELESENPSWNTKKLKSEVSKLWKAASNDVREKYEIEAACSSEELDVAELSS